MQDEQREKQLSPLETVGQILKRSIGTKSSKVSENEGTQCRSKHQLPAKSPSPYKVDPFVNHIAPFSIYDKIKVNILYNVKLKFRTIKTMLKIILRTVLFKVF